MRTGIRTRIPKIRRDLSSYRPSGGGERLAVLPGICGGHHRRHIGLHLQSTQFCDHCLKLYLFLASEARRVIGMRTRFEQDGRDEFRQL